MGDKKDRRSINNRNKVMVDQKSHKTDIYRGSGSYHPDEPKGFGHAHTVVKDIGGQPHIVYDRDEGGTVFVDANTKNGDALSHNPIPLPSNDD